MAGFTRGEMERRLAVTRGFMDDGDLDALVLFANRARQAGVCWLSQYRDPQSCYLVVPRDGDPTLLVSAFDHLPNARELSSMPAVWAGERTADEIAARLRAAGARRVGLVGGVLGMGMPYLHHRRITELLPDAALSDATDGYMRLQLVKSEEEIERMRDAAALTDLGLRALVVEARPGVSDRELVAHIEHAYQLKGGQVGITYLRSMPMDAPTGCVPAQSPSGRRLAVGDVIICELSAVCDGYSGQVLWPVFVGAEPSGQWKRLLDAGIETYHALERGLRHGASVADAIAWAEPIRASGFTICDGLIHGMGLGLSAPWVDPEDFHAPPADGGMRLERGMVVVIQPNPITRDERMGLQMGGATVVRDDGVERLHTIPDGPLIATAPLV